jgi:hypothetical protein
MESSEVEESVQDDQIRSEAKAQLLGLFQRNPWLMDEVESIARRAGKRKESVEADLKDLVKVGALHERRIGSTTVFSLNGKRDSEMRKAVGSSSMGIKREMTKLR